LLIFCVVWAHPRYAGSGFPLQFALLRFANSAAIPCAEEAANFPERMAKTAQVLSSLNENFFDFFDFAVKKFCGSSVGQGLG
jgi:hypothetical protein